jgi:hypothetical protein
MTRVLYLTGWCRSGSTLLGNLLNELPGVVHVGELHYLWRNGVLRTGTNSVCGCGVEVLECPLWTKVLGAVGADGPGAVALARAALRDQEEHLRARYTGRRLAEATGRRAAAPGAVGAVDRIVALYQAVADATGAHLVVDSSKYPAEAAALCGRNDVDARVLHLVRDPRATAYSWLRPKGYIPAMGVLRGGLYWTGFNAASDRIGAAFPERYLRLRYEDFARDPVRALCHTLELAGVAAPVPVDADGQAALDVNHTVTGNPDRLARGTVRVRPDDAWRSGLSRRHRVAATVLAAPLLRRYGYR